MIAKAYETEKGIIRYWISEQIKGRPYLIFLPGLTADHRLFEKQIEFFEGKYGVFVWDAPGHADSYPFVLDFTLMDKARWLSDILEEEQVQDFVLIGQSMGGYVSQAFMELYPDKPSGFISIDSAPLQKEYMKNWEIAALKRTEGMYRMYPWKRLLKDGAWGCAETPYGRQLMQDIMRVYDGDKERYVKLSGHGFRMLADAVEADLPYEISCPALLICGEKDKAGSAKRYNRKWGETTGIRVRWIPGAGHNANTDQPQLVNSLIEEFVKENVENGDTEETVCDEG